MPIIRTATFIVGALFAFSSGSLSQSAATGVLKDLAWIVGDWQTIPSNGRQVDEHWTEALGGTMMGNSRTVADGKTVEFEYLRIEERPDGIYYVAHPNARAPGTDFKLTKMTADQAIFENPQHDFPKRIFYKKNADGSITASVDGGEGTRVRSFPYQPLRRQ